LKRGSLEGASSLAWSFEGPSHGPFSSASLWPLQRLLVRVEAVLSHGSLRGLSWFPARPSHDPLQGPSKCPLHGPVQRGLWTGCSKTPCAHPSHGPSQGSSYEPAPGWTRPGKPFDRMNRGSSRRMGPNQLFGDSTDPIRAHGIPHGVPCGASVGKSGGGCL